MVLSVKSAGSWATVKDLFVKHAGAWVPVQKAFVKSAGAWVEYYAAEVVAIVSASVNDLDVSTLFSPEDWASTKKKRVIIQPGVVVGATSVATAALRTGTGRGGLLFIENGGDIRGAGGAANGGAGGPAVNVQEAGLSLDNSGFIRGGGGGGGKGGTGGTGGQGYYQTYYQEGPHYDGGNYRWISGTGAHFKWAGATYYPAAATSYQVGNIIYYRGAFQSENSSQEMYAIYRRVFYNVYTNGGAGGPGGNGGVGIGHGQSATTGAGGAGGGAPGTNAGWGGTGGTGGTGGSWGQPGTAGATGNTGGGGNYTGGLAGAAGGAGGAAGAAITGLARTLFNTGTIQGAT